MTTYEARNDAISAEVLEPIQDGLDQGENASELFDIEAIADEVLAYGSVHGDYRFWVSVDQEDFWDIVLKHRR